MSCSCKIKKNVPLYISLSISSLYSRIQKQGNTKRGTSIVEIKNVSCSLIAIIRLAVFRLYCAEIYALLHLPFSLLSILCPAQQLLFHSSFYITFRIYDTFHTRFPTLVFSLKLFRHALQRRSSQSKIKIKIIIIDSFVALHGVSVRAASDRIGETPSLPDATPLEIN